MNTQALQSMTGQRFFESWDGFRAPDKIAASEEALQALLHHLLESGPNMEEPAARASVNDVVRRFNDLDDGWIETMEREDICERIFDILDAAGFEADEDWLGERDW